MSSDLETRVREIEDRQAIHDCVSLYCRAVDRLDRELLASLYHADAIDDHGDYCGDVPGFIDWVFNYHGTLQDRTQHVIANHICDLQGDVAHCETYWTFYALNKPVSGMPRHTRAAGRYVDRFEKRDGRWAIALRVCLLDTGSPDLDPEGVAGDLLYQPSTRDRSDPSYQRPLTVPASRLTK